MDTVYLTWDCAQVRKDVVCNLERMGQQMLGQRDKDGRKLSGRRGYQSTLAVSVNGHRVFAAYDPQPEFSDLPELFLTIHLSHFESMQHALCWLRSIFGNSFSALPDGKILRLDRCIDLSLPFETLLRTMTQDKIIHVLKFVGRRRSLYLGKLPRQTYLYEKLIKPEYLDNQPPPVFKLDSLGRLKGVRLEARMSKGKLPIKKFGDLDKLRTINPFEHLSFNELSEALISNTEGRHIINAYLRCRSEHGAQIAKLEFSGGRNFNRDIGRYLAPVKMDTATWWAKRVSRFFGDGPVCFNQSFSTSIDTVEPIDKEEMDFLFGTTPPAEALEDDPEMEFMEPETAPEDVELEEPCANSFL